MKVNHADFETITKTVYKAGRCPVCFHVTRRTRTFSENVTRFNRVADRTRPKTRDEVRASVAAAAQAWLDDQDLRHERCKDS